MLTVKGDFSNWLKPASIADQLGVSVYRNNWNPYINYINLPIRPVFYKKMANLTKKFTDVKDVIIIDFQAEPRGPKFIYEMSSIEMAKSMDLTKFNKSIKYAKETGFNRIYLTGAEWWFYCMNNGNNSFWNVAKEIWNQ